MEYCLLDLGILRSPQAGGLAEQDDDTGKVYFSHERQRYEQLVPALNMKVVLRYVRRVPEYSVKHRTEASDGERIYLGLFLRMLGPDETLDYGCLLQRKYLVDVLFDQVEEYDFIMQELSPSPPAPVAVATEQLYSMLREAHKSDSLDANIPTEIVHHHLQPQLRQYQQNAVRWMIDRETVPRTLPAQYAYLSSKVIPEEEFFMDLMSFEVRNVRPKPIAIPSGGILADEMGLGKTVEILALLLFNKWKKREALKMPDDEDDKDSDYDDGELKCVCVKTSRKKTIACRKCGQLQHRSCMLKHALKQMPKRYLCPECWRSEPLVESGSTIIVSPVSIKMQWATEIQKHINDANFKTFIYDGVSESGWISPADLAQYDVVLTDYNVLKTEIYFTSSHSRNSRHQKRFLNPVSPLPLIRWWRVCLDEAQLVEGIHNQTTKMVKTLPAVHRWTVTGTPIESNLNNLYGLIHFLNYAPYNDYPIWNRFKSLFYTSPQPLVHMMARIMWRTCESDVLDQLGIPPQEEVIHYITMCDLQSFFYRMEHSKCELAFCEKAAKLGKDIQVVNMNLHKLNLLMEPMRKLRQDCTIPSVLQLRCNAPSAKKLLTPTELHEHLINTNENDCKSQLRSVVSSLNGIAALHIIRQEYDQAVKFYKSALRWADDYKGPISVDTLLQIHTLHNMVEVLKIHLDGTVPEAELSEYEDRCAKLQWKYVEQYASIVKSVETELTAASAKVEETINALGNAIDGRWYRDVLHPYNADQVRHDNFIRKLNIERRNHDKHARWISTVSVLDYLLTNWLDKLRNNRKELLNAFSRIEFFTSNLAPKQHWTAEIAEKIERLVRAAFACHLNPALLTEDELARKPTCLLCEVKDSLNRYEAIMFESKKLETAAKTGGLWQMTLYELGLKQIFATAKREHANETIVSEGELFFEYIERLKSEFKEYSKYWVETNYAVAACDELNMCTSRMQVVTYDEAKTIKTIQQVYDFEVDETMEGLMQQKLDSEREFVRLKGSLGYLRRLGSAQDVEVCPICQTKPEQRYAVLQCGHHFCSVCEPELLKIARNHGNHITCVVCRHRQPCGDIYHVCRTSSSLRLQGNYSNKIIKIIETILQLKMTEPNVKIVVFSHWEPILVRLSQALEENSITFRQKSSKFYKSIEDFKDPAKGITCLLLPLRYGSKGLNLVEATHVFLVEPIINLAEELQAIGRVHRIGQTRPTFVHRFIVHSTIEENIYETIHKDLTGFWRSKRVTVSDMQQLFLLNDNTDDEIISDGFDSSA